jgi:TRAP-type C4-dicarboxylate transport system permease small subunit
MAATPPRTKAQGAGTRDNLAIRALRVLVALFSFCMMALTFVDVVGRYLLNAPINGSFELIEILLALVVFTGLPLVVRDNSHIGITMLQEALRGRIQRAHRFVVDLFSGGALLFIAFCLWDQARGFMIADEVTGNLKIPIGLTVYPLCVLAAVAGLLQLLNTLGLSRQLPADRRLDE